MFLVSWIHRWPLPHSYSSVLKFLVRQESFEESYEELEQLGRGNMQGERTLVDLRCYVLHFLNQTSSAVLQCQVLSLVSSLLVARTFECSELHLDLHLKLLSFIFALFSCLFNFPFITFFYSRSPGEFGVVRRAFHRKTGQQVAAPWRVGSTCRQTPLKPSQ